MVKKFSAKHFVFGMNAKRNSQKNRFVPVAYKPCIGPRSSDNDCLSTSVAFVMIIIVIGAICNNREFPRIRFLFFYCSASENFTNLPQSFPLNLAFFKT